MDDCRNTLTTFPVSAARPRLRRWALLALSFTAALAVAQTAPTAATASRPQLRTVQVKRADSPEALKLPLLEGGGAVPAAAAARVNEFLAMQLIESLPPERWSASWAPPVPPDDSLSELSFEKLRLDERVLSVATESLGCGAYCEIEARTYLFDLRTGRRVELSELVTAAGLRKLVDQAQRERLAVYGQLLKRQQADLRKGKKKPSKEAADEADEALAFTEQCLADARKSEPGFAQVQLLPAVLQVRLAPCAINHATRGLDTAGSIAVKLPLSQLSPDLTPYGHELLEGATGASAPPPQWDGQVLKGQIAGNPVTMLLRITGSVAPQSVSGLYFYDRHRKPIRLSGELRPGPQLLLTEQSDAQARLKLKVEGGQLSGEWVGKKTHPVQLQGL